MSRKRKKVQPGEEISSTEKKRRLEGGEKPRKVKSKREKAPKKLPIQKTHPVKMAWGASGAGESKKGVVWEKAPTSHGKDQARSPPPHERLLSKKRDEKGKSHQKNRGVNGKKENPRNLSALP